MVPRKASILESISFSPATEKDYHWAFELKVAAEKQYIERIFGWDLELQKVLHQEKWSEGIPTKILWDDNPVGTYLLQEGETDYSFGRFFVLPELQNKGIGSFVLTSITQKLDEQSKDCRLCHLQGNPAGNLYKRFGFQCQKEDSEFIYLKRSPKKIENEQYEVQYQID
ncbi:GNAT family N-acetyltransferase [Endozoicomonas arenosclerae]|uniref:GNAT family N-acetyltransferase n=1 Tax=Endozoicomonas arenosclerae TaxID=1633495 RepID=UPI0007832440|nr:GNAT family N-acetyltransferase [Endozoicomonas arenosclerae]